MQLSKPRYYINGWLYDDAPIGNFTCCSHRGNSVVDYVVMDPELILRIKPFLVQPCTHTIYSDHCALTFFHQEVFLKPFCKTKKVYHISALAHQMHSKNYPRNVMREPKYLKTSSSTQGCMNSLHLKQSGNLQTSTSHA